MRKKITMLLALVLCAFSSSAVAQTYYRPGARTTTLEVGKQYFISAATFYNNARPNLLYNNNGTLAYSDNKKPNALINDASYLFTVVKIGANNIYYITNSEGKYLQANTLDSDATEKGVTIVPYSKVKGGIACGSDVQACDELGNKIEYNNITDDTPIVCVYHNNSTGWRHISGLQAGKSTPFAFYEVEKVFPEITTDESNPKWYTIKNVRGNAYAYYNGTGTAMGMSGTVDKAAYLFYFTAGKTEGTYKIHNYVNSKLCAAPNSWTDEGIDWHIQISGSTVHPGLAISKDETLTAEGDEAWNDYQNNHNSVNWYGGNDDGSTWQIERYEFESILPTVQLSTNDNIVLHYIRSQRRTNFVNFDGHNKTFKEGDKGLSSYWYFVQDEEAQENAPAGFVACRIYNAAYATGVENHSSGYMGDASWPARVYYIGTGEYERNGYLIYRADANLDNNGYGCWHDKAGGSIMDYHKNDAGSYWRIYPSETTSADLMQQAAEAKTNVLNMISGMYEYADYYTYTDEAIADAKNEIDAVNIGNITGAVQSLINSSFESILTTLKETQKSAAPAAGDYIQLKNREHKKYLKAFDTDAEGADNMSDHATVWYVEAGEGGNFRLRNLATKKYVGHIRKSATTAMQEDVANAAQFSWSNQEDVYAVFKDVDVTGVAEGDVDYVYGHVNGGKLVGWVANATSSQWAVAKISADSYRLALQEEIARATAFIGTAVGQKAVVDAVALENLKSAAQALVDGGSTDILALHHTKLELAAMVDAGTVNLPAVGKYYQIKSANPDFYKKQGKEMGIYSSDNEGRLAWKALDSSNKAFYWTITPKDGKFIFKNEADGKYIPAVVDDKYVMTATEAEAKAFTLTWLTAKQFKIEGNGTMHMMGHSEGAGTGDRICSWNGGINSSSAWTIVEVEHPDLAASKASLQNRINELNTIIANMGDAIGQYKDGNKTALQEQIAIAQGVLDGGSGIPNVYTTALATLNENIATLDYSLILPVAGKYYQIKSADPRFLDNQDVEMAMYSNADGLLAWKALNEAERSFYWTITPNNDGTSFIFQNAGDNKYIPAVANNSYTMTADANSAQGFTFIFLGSRQFNITGSGTMHMLSHSSGKGTGGQICNHPGELDSPSAWYIVEVDLEWAIAKAQLELAVYDAMILIDSNSDAPGFYGSDEEGLADRIQEINRFKANITSQTLVADIQAQTALAKEIIASFKINLPKQGKFYRFKHPTKDVYMLSNATTVNSNKRLAMGELDGNEVPSIFYQDGNALLSYAIGQYLSTAPKNDATDWTCLAVGTAAPAVTYGPGTTLGTLGFYLGSDASRAYYSARETYVDAGGSIAGSEGYDWEIEEVTTLPVTVSSVGYATLYAPVALEIPANMTAYVGVHVDNYLDLTDIKEVTGGNVIPANTGVILEAKQGTYNFAIVDDVAALDKSKNLLTGKYPKSVKNAEKKVYTLQNGTNGVGLYLFKGQNAQGATTYINGFRAWVELPADAKATALRIRKAGTTEIEETLADGEQEMVIYDLAGRRIDKIVEKGIYIVNGKKVVIS